MASESLFIKCKACGKQISKTAKSCPQCGAKQRELTLIYWIGIIFVGSTIIGLITGPEPERELDFNKSDPMAADSQKPQPTQSQMPEDQLVFVNAITEYSSGFGGAKNELQQSAMRDQRKTAIESALEGYSVGSWVGTIKRLETNTEGKAMLSVRIAPDIEVKTWNNALSDIGSNTLIEKGSSVFNSLYYLSSGLQVKFSGTFFPSRTDFVQETSMTIEGSMRNPEFLFKFSSVEPIKEGGGNGSN